MPRKNLSKGVPITEIARLTGGRLLGDSGVVVTNICSLDDPIAGALAFLSGRSLKRAADELAQTPVKAFLVNSEVGEIEIPPRTALIIVENPLAAMIKCVPLFFEPHTSRPGISPHCEIDPSAQIGRDVRIGPFSSIGASVCISDGVTIHSHVSIYPGVTIGPRSVIHSHAVLREDTILGADSVVQNGAVIGADGFGYLADSEIGLRSVPQIGHVELGDRVDVGANACVDRATLGRTIIGTGTKIDNLVQIGHNVRIGSHTIICGQTGVAGSTTIGHRVVLGGNSGLADHIRIGDDVRIGAKAGVVHDILDGGDYAGFPAIPANNWRRSMAMFRELPRIIKRTRLRPKKNVE